MNIANRIREWRDKEGVTLEDLARRLDVSTATVWKWENGKRQPTGLYRKKIEAFLRRVGA